jgi:hypothetical protein
MRNKKNIVIVCSLILNVLLVIVFLVYYYYTATSLKRIVFSHYDTMIGQSRHVLLVLDSNDPGEIYRLKRSLEAQIDSNTRAVESMRRLLK